MHILRNHEKTEAKICEECGKEFKAEELLKRHFQSVHEDQELMMCNFQGCGKSFRGKLRLKMHSKIHQNNPKKHLCQFCPKKFRSPSLRLKHEKLRHLNWKELKCDLCDFKTGLLVHLKQHKKFRHEGLKYDCDIPGCSKSLKSCGALNSHKWKAHKVPKTEFKDEDQY